MAQPRQSLNDAKVERLGKDGVENELEVGIIKALDKYVKKGFTKEETMAFLNQVSQYFAVSEGMGIDNARTIVPLNDISGHGYKHAGITLGFCPPSADADNGDKIGVNKSFVNILSHRVVRAKNLLTAGVILVGHENTHAMQGVVAQRADEGGNVTEEQRAFLVADSLDPSSRAGMRQVISNLNKLTGEKVDTNALIASLGAYYGNAKEVEARRNGIAFCRDLYQSLKDNPEIENYPEVNKWLSRQDGMIGFHEKTEQFLDKTVITKYRNFLENCNVPDDKLISFAEEQEQTWVGVDKDGLNDSEEADLMRKFAVYDTTIKFALNNKSEAELKGIYSRLDEKKTPFLKQIIERNLTRRNARDGQNAHDEKNEED